MAYIAATFALCTMRINLLFARIRLAPTAAARRGSRIEA